MYKLILLLLLPVFSHAQHSDILLLKKNNRTIGHFFPGSYISFFTKQGMLVSGNIDSVKRDSLYMRYFDVRMLPNGLGTFYPDTIAAYQQLYAINEIAAFPIRNKKFNLIRNGSLLMLGGGAYLVLNVVNTLREGDPLFGSENIARVIGGAAALATGIALNKTQRTKYKLGKKYRLMVLPASK